MMRNFFIAIMVFAVSGLNAQSYKADTDKTMIKWTGEKVTGKHWGHINLKSGDLTMNEGKITGGTFVIDMSSIVNKDIEDDGYNKKLVGHLKSDDFFGVEKYPTAKLVITKATAFKDNKADVRGDLTIKEKTESILFTVTKDGDKYTAKIVVDRSKFDVK
ncbi:MAG: YceI family protein, partial [Chloroflexia bacterium]|nr:YceI family protein [Chloroflexia bacterium]